MIEHFSDNPERLRGLVPLAGELQPAFGRVRQLPQDDGTRDGRRIRVTVLFGGTFRAR